MTPKHDRLGLYFPNVHKDICSLILKGFENLMLKELLIQKCYFKIQKFLENKPENRSGSRDYFVYHRARNDKSLTRTFL